MAGQEVRVSWGNSCQSGDVDDVRVEVHGEEYASWDGSAADTDAYCAWVDATLDVLYQELMFNPPKLDYH